MDSYNILLCLSIAITGTVYSSILTEPDQVFYGVYKWLEKVFPEYLFRPIIGCHKCVTGQLTLWAFAILFSNKYILLFSGSEFLSIFKLLFTHVFLICISILFSCLINKLYLISR